MASVSMSRRTIALILAVALAALATIALISYIRGLEDKALQGQLARDVFVAKQDIPAGVSGDTASQQGLVERRTVPAKIVPQGAITSLEQISGHLAAVQIYKDEIIVQQRFVLPGAAVKGVLPIPVGKQAISVAITGAPAVAGFVQPGDQVSLIVTETQRGGSAARTSASTAGPFTHYLLQNLDVIAVGTRIVSSSTSATANTNAQQTDQGIFTLAVTPSQAEQIAFAIGNTTLYFTLLPEKAPRAATAGRQFANLFS